MSETSKVVLAAVLGIIIGFGFGRFSTDRQADGLSEENDVIETGDVSAPDPSESEANTSGTNARSGEDSDGDAATATDKSGVPTTSTKDPVSQQTSVSSAVTALDQPAGMSVKMLVSIDRRGWVAVHEETAGRPARILGAKPYGPATGEVRVNLLRGTTAGNKYYVMLHSDDGDINDFSLSRDLPLLGANGQPIMISFMAL